MKYLMWPNVPIRHQIPALLTILLGVAVTVFFYSRVRAWEEERITNKFSMSSRLAIETFQRNLDTVESQFSKDAYYLVNLLSAAPETEEAAFQKFSRKIWGDYPGLEGLFFIRSEPGSGAERIYRYSDGASGRKGIAGGWKILTSTSAPANDGKLQSQGPVQVDRGGRECYAVEIACPMIAAGPDGEDSIVGHLVGLFWMKELFADSLLHVRRDGLEYLLTVRDSPGDPYRFDVRLGEEGSFEGVTGQKRIEIILSGEHEDHAMSFAGREIEATISPTPGYLSSSRTQWQWWVLAGGFFFSVLLGDYFLVLAIRVAEFERLAGEHVSALSAANDALARQLSLSDRASNQLSKLTQAMEHSPVAVLITDMQGIVEYVNEKYSGITGYPKQELEGKPASILEPGCLDEEELAALWDAMTRGKEWHSEYRDRLKDGEVMDFGASMAPIKDSEGKVSHYVFMINDITERRKLQEQFLQSQKMEVIGRLAGGVVHDLSNMLTVILGFSQIVQSQLEEDDPLMEDINEIIRVGERAGDLNRQLLSFARTQAGKAERVTVNKMISDMEKFLKHTLGEDIQLTFDLVSEGDVILIDPGQYNQLIMNLGVNARDAMMPAGGDLHISTKITELPADLIRVHKLKPCSQVELRVRDTGCGMSEEVREHLFEPFFTTKEEGKGTGLGLSTVYGIVTRFKGGIMVDSEEGSGTEFRIYFPVHVGSADEETESGPVEVPRGKETILLVEDDRDLRTLCIHLLKALGYNILEASCGREALEIAHERKQDIDLVMTDIIMPEMNGLELANRLREVRPDFKIVFTTGFSEHPLVVNTTAFAESTLLRKPFTREELGFCVRAMLDNEPIAVEMLS